MRYVLVCFYKVSLFGNLGEEYLVFWVSFGYDLLVFIIICSSIVLGKSKGNKVFWLCVLMVIFCYIREYSWVLFDFGELLDYVWDRFVWFFGG